MPYALLTLDWTCAGHGTGDHEIRSTLFPDAEGYVKGTKTIVTYDVDGLTGSAASTRDTRLSRSASPGRSASGSSSGSAPNTC